MPTPARRHSRWSRPAADLSFRGLTVRLSMYDPEKEFVLRYFILEEKLNLGEPTPSYARSE